MDAPKFRNVAILSQQRCEEKVELKIQFLMKKLQLESFD